LILALLMLCAPVAVLPAQQPIPQQQEQTKDQIVYINRTGEKYHCDGCRFLSQSRILIFLKNAKARGYTPCSVCRPPL